MTNPNNNISEIDPNLRIYEIYPYHHSTFTEYVEVIADDTHMLVILHIHVLQAASLRDLLIFHFGVVLVHTADVGPAVTGGADLQRTAGVSAEFDLGRHCLDLSLIHIFRTSLPKASSASTTPSSTAVHGAA